MKLVTFTLGGSESAPGIWLDGGEVLNLPKALALDDSLASEVTPGLRRAFDSLQTLIAAGDVAHRVLEKINSRAMSAGFAPARVAQSAVTLLAPIPRPHKNIFCVGRNYVDHVKEGYTAQGLDIKLPEHIQLFSKPPTTVIGPEGNIRYDATLTQKLDYEVELGVVLGKTGRDIAADSAYEHIFGYTVINDISARDLQRRHDQWFKGKGLDTSCPMGPWIVTKDEIADPQDLAISLKVNGETRQQARTSQMIFNLRRILADLSRGLTLEAGDIIATGTPSGVGYAMDPPRLLAAGDIIECEIEHIGKLVNRVIAV
jgi:2-keto-4-pentenoate hydratase/2-oxohepta-3-ene-1,7-dioic acid hydratase in catechol pathway